MSLVKPHGSDVLLPLLLEGEALVAELARGLRPQVNARQWV